MEVASMSNMVSWSCCYHLWSLICM